MLKLTLDGQSVDTEHLRGHTLSQLIAAIERELTPERVIVSLTLDGRRLDKSDERQQAASALENLGKLEITTQRVDSLARGTLDNVIAFIPNLAGSVSDCVESLQSADESAGHQHLEKVIDGLQIISSAWPLIAASLAGEGATAAELMPDTAAFNDLLHRIAAAQEAGDTVQLCDLLEFELAEILETWLIHARQLRESAAMLN